MNVGYKYRGGLMVIGLFVMLPIVVWRYAVGNTVRTVFECRHLHRELEVSTDSVGQRFAEPYRCGEQDLILSGVILDSLCDYLDGGGVHVSGYTPVVTGQNGPLSLHTAELILTGDFHDMLLTLHHIETSFSECVVRSAVWRVVQDRAARAERLTLTVYVEQLVKGDD